MGALEGRVALVAGATRGAGRGIAIELGAAGATVYCTGRSTRTQRSEVNRPETIEETAELVERAGGKAVAVQVDHLVPDQVQALVGRIEREQGRLDLLVKINTELSRQDRGRDHDLGQLSPGVVVSLHALGLAHGSPQCLDAFARSLHQAQCGIGQAIFAVPLT